RLGIVEIPVLIHLHVFLCRQQKLPRRYFEDAVVQSSRLVLAHGYGLEHIFMIPASRDACRKQRFYLRSEIERVILPGVEQRFDSKAIAGRNQASSGFIPQHQRKLAAQMVEELQSEVFVEMECDLTVRLRPQPVPTSFQVALNRLITIE